MQDGSRAIIPRISIFAIGWSEFRYGTQPNLLRWDPLPASETPAEGESADIRREPDGTRRRRDVPLPPTWSNTSAGPACSVDDVVAILERFMKMRTTVRYGEAP